MHESMSCYGYIFQLGNFIPQSYLNTEIILIPY